MTGGTLRIRTPQGITFSLLLAGPITRLLALAVDLSCVVLAMQFLATAAAGIGWMSTDIATALQILAYVALSIGYGTLTEWLWRGQTIGKRLLRLRVIDEQGLRLQFSQILIRNLLRAVDMLPGLYLVGGMAMLLSRRAQRLGDYAANTVVVRSERVLEPDLDQLLSGKFNSLREQAVLAARLRQRVTPVEASLAMRALVRRDDLDPAARVDLFRAIATHFRAIVPFPPEATEGLADEQYIRNVVDIVFRPKPAATAERAGAGGLPGRGMVPFAHS